VSGLAGTSSTGNNIGAGAGGGGGVVVLSPAAAETFGITFNLAAGASHLWFLYGLRGGRDVSRGEQRDVQRVVMEASSGRKGAPAR
jgi:hypothetical protein